MKLSEKHEKLPEHCEIANAEQSQVNYQGQKVILRHIQPSK